MAYGIIYKFRAETVKYKSDVKINILKNGYAGTSTDKYLGAGGVTLTKDSAGVICGTSLSFAIQADSDFEYLSFFESAPREYLVQLLIDDVIKWQGYLIGDEYREAFRNPPYDVAITATDGLGLLKNYPYTVISTPTVKTSRIDVIREILENTGLNLNISVAYGAATAGGVNLFNVAFADDYFAGWTCYEVLEKMIPPDATITQHGGMWLIRRNEQDSETAPKIYDYVDGLGYSVTDGDSETPLALAPIGTGDVYPIGQAELNMQHAWSSMELFSEHAKRPSFCYNHDFSDGLNHWEESTPTGNVTVWDADQGSYVKITGEHAVNAEDVTDVWVKQSFPYTAVDGEGFSLEFKYCAIGYVVLLLGGGLTGKKATDVTIKGRIEFTNGGTTWYLDEKDGWSTTNKNFEHKQLGTIVGLTWTDFKIYADRPPLSSGTMTIYLYGLIEEGYKTLEGVMFTDVVIHPIAWNDYPDSYRYDVSMKSGATERQTVTILPTSAPDIANFDRMFYNGQTHGGTRVDAFVSGGNTYTFTNLILNSLKFLHGTTRQLLQGYFRGSGMSLNSIIGCAATDGRKYFVESGAWEVLNDKFNLNLLEIPGSASGSSWAVGTTDFSTSAEWSNNTSSGSGSSETVIGGGGVYTSGGGSWLDSYFELVNGGTTGEYIRALRDFASTGEITAYNASDTSGSNMWDAMPIATTGELGGVIVDGTTITINELGVISSAASGGGGATDHGALTGLADDDHPQYLNNTRGDARYQQINEILSEIIALYTGTASGTPVRGGGVWALEEYVTNDVFATFLNAKQPKDADLTAIAALTGTTGLLKKTAANTWTLDTTAYLTGITKAMVEAVLTGLITSHTHSYESPISKSAGYLTWNGSAWEFKNEAYSLSAHNHDGTYEPAFSKNTAFNKNFGTAAGTVTEGNDSRLSDARTPLSHTHGNLTNDGKIGVVSGKPIITSAAGVLTTGSFGSAAGTFAQGNDSRFHTHSNESNLNEINQDLGTGDDVHFLSADVTSLEVDAIVDGVLQTGFGTNLLKYSNLFENAVWTKYNCTAYDNNAENPFGGDTIKAAFLLWDSSSPVCQQTITHSGTGNYTFSVWLRADTEHTAYMRVISSAQTPASTAILIKNTWQRFSVTYNFTSAHTTKSVRIELGNEDIFIFGAQLEGWEAPTRYINTGSAGVSETGVHAYGDLRVNGSIVAADEVTAFSDARLKHDIRETTPALQRLMEVNVVDYVMNGDKTGKLRTGVIAQQILPLFPQMVEGSEADYLSVNYEKLVSVAIKAIQELNEKVKRLENILAENGISE